jgi:hypothetical protein
MEENTVGGAITSAGDIPQNVKNFYDLPGKKH